MDKIRAMEHRDCPRVAELHHKAMGNSLWAQLGKRFLIELYRGLVDSPYFLAFVYEEREENGELLIQGFIAGSTDTDAMFQKLFRRRYGLLLLCAAPGILRRPQLIPRLLQTHRYSQVSQNSRDRIPGESLFCSFSPALRGKRISGHINKVLFDDLFARGHQFVKVTTERDNEGANRQLQSWGFEAQEPFSFYGKDMVCYILDLAASERVESNSRHRAV